MNTPQQTAVRRKRTRKVQLHQHQHSNAYMIVRGKVIENWAPEYRADMMRRAESAQMSLDEFMIERNRRFFVSLMENFGWNTGMLPALAQDPAGHTYPKRLPAPGELVGVRLEGREEAYRQLYAREMAATA